jgi:phosphatidylglycerol:prolipoprotein diacylglycerol transferase
LLSLAAAASAVHVPIYWTDLGLQRGIDLHFFTLRYYSLAYLAGILLAWWHLSRMIRQPGAPLAQRHVDDLFFWCTLGVIFGGRLGYATFYGPQLWTHPLELLKLWEGGMSFHGGLIGVVVAIGWVCWRGGLNFLRVCDYMAPCAPMGLFFGRLANFVNGELWGRVAGPEVPWAMVFPGAGSLPRHPSQLYEAVLEGLVLTAILVPLFWKTRARWRPGLLAGLFGLGYGAARFVVEFFREPDEQLRDFAEATHMSMGQWLTTPMIVIGLVLVARALARPAQGSPVPVSA